MATNHAATEEPQSEPKAKKPYQKPAFRHEQVFVTTALSCTKATSSCVAMPKS
jgi:hypothetical protein